MCGRGRAGVRQERTAQYGGRMFVFATTQGVQGDMPSAIASGLGEKSKTVGSSEAGPAELRTSRYGGRLNVLRLPRDSVCVRSRGSETTSQVGSSRLDRRVPPCRRRRLAQVRDDGEI